MSSLCLDVKAKLWSVWMTCRQSSLRFFKCSEASRLLPEYRTSDWQLSEYLEGWTKNLHSLAAADEEMYSEQYELAAEEVQPEIYFKYISASLINYIACIVVVELQGL